MGRGLVGHDVDVDAAADQLGEHLGRVAGEPDRQRAALAPGGVQPAQRVVQVGGALVQVAAPDPALDPLDVDLDAERRAVEHRDGQRLGAAHAAQAGGHHQPPGQRSVKALAGRRGERLVRPLEDPLTPDVDPGARGHLAVHDQPGRVEPAELVPVGPVRHQVGVGDQHARRVLVGLEHRHRLARLNEQRLVVAEALELGHDRVVARPVARRLADAAVDDQLGRVLGHVRMEVVLKHAQGGFLLPALAAQRRGAHAALASGAPSCARQLSRHAVPPPARRPRSAARSPGRSAPAR